MVRNRKAILILALLLFPISRLNADDLDDCDTDLIAAIGSNAYQFNPRLSGDFGSVRLFTILSYEAAAARGDFGRAFWRLEIRPAGSSRPVRMVRGIAALEESGSALAEFRWDGRDDAGKEVLPGKYQFTFKARYRSDRALPARFASRYDDLRNEPEAVEAFSSVSEVILNDTLTAAGARALRVSLALAGCPVQRNEPLEDGFPYNFYYGSTHSHSNFSDGGLPATTACQSGRYGRGTSDPAAVFDYARNTARLDYWVVNEHNHLLNDAEAFRNPSFTPADVRQRYQDGRTAAANATENDAFVALYGMEWGVTTALDQGHVTLLETPVLFGWEPVDCTSNCYWDVFTAKRGDYLGLYAQSVANPPPMTGAAAGILCHPRFTHFDGFAFNASANDALQGIAVRSGLAFTRGTGCSDVAVGLTDYTPVWLAALDKGFHVGPVADHDAHCENFGVAIPNRTVYLLPIPKSTKEPTLTKAALLSAHSARHFFATEDPNVQLVFVASGGRIMGDIFTVAAGTAIDFRGTVYDPDGETVETIEIWRGEPGRGVPRSPYVSLSGVPEILLNDRPQAGTYYYFVHAVQPDGHDIWSSPIWVTFSCTDEDTPVVAIVSPTNNSEVSGTVTIQVSATDATCGILNAEVSIDGGPWRPAPFNAGTGYYESVWNSAAGCGGPATIDAHATDRSQPPHTGVASRVNVTVVKIDTQPPTVAIVSPAPGARIICADTLVQVSASDASGIALVEVQIGAGPWNEATLDPDTGYYEYGWPSGSAPPGDDTINVRATDASCSANMATGTPVTVTVEGGNCIAGWRLFQNNSPMRDIFYDFPPGTRIPENGYLVIGRNVDKAAFETYWRTTLGPEVVYINGANRFPQINGDERYTLLNERREVVDGETIRMPRPTGTRAWDLERLAPCSPPEDDKSWRQTLGDPHNFATPGWGAGPGCGRGVMINEFSDTLGSGTFPYEFIELYADNGR